MVFEERPGDSDRIATVEFLANKAANLLAGSAAPLLRRRRGLRLLVEGDYIHGVHTFCPPIWRASFCDADGRRSGPRQGYGARAPTFGRLRV